MLYQGLLFAGVYFCMYTKLRLVMAQLNFLVGDIEGNVDKIIANAIKARDELKADLIIFPELTLTSYPPEDLLLRPRLYDRVSKALEKLQLVKGIDIIVGYPEKTIDGVYNKASLFRDGEIIASHYKEYLPNYSVFDEKRYFVPGNSPTITAIKGIPFAITICEDLWYPEPMLQAAKAGAKIMISINASPFEVNKPLIREEIMSKRAKEGKMPLIYVNLIGGQDELIFDGGSMVINTQGQVCQSAGFYNEILAPVDLEINDAIHIKSAKVLPLPSVEERVYQALVLGVRDYIEKNGFKGAIIGLSGGIDSALTLAIAVDAIGKDRVQGVLMPSRFSSELSINEAKVQAELLGVKYRIISIEPIFQSFLSSLASEFAGIPEDATEQNLQARCRGTLLMALSNKFGLIVLSTGNKSEMSVGYSTLYGDMVGGFCVLKDVPKTLVYRLANYRNQISPTIPPAIIHRAPSAELAANQKDEDDLPPYSILDQIIEKYIEQDKSPSEIIALGFDANTVKRVVKMVNRNEYKRRQAPVGVRITGRAFGRDRRYPITSGYSRYLSGSDE